MNNKYIIYGYGLSCMLLLLSACTKMNDTYHDFWNNGELIYPASPDSLKAFSGRNRIKLQWLNIGDPTLKQAVIYWNNHSDSLVVPIEGKETAGADTMDVVIDPLPEGAYSFDIFTYDAQGSQSVVANVIGKAYGDTYAGSLLTRLVTNNALLNDTLTVDWGDPADAKAIGKEILYIDTVGNQRHRVVAANADTTLIADYDNHASKYFKYRTLFLPDSTAIDTFYTAYDSVRVLGARTELSKSGWTIEVSSYDNRNGRTDRLPEKLIDENTSTNWVNLVGPTAFPHTAVIDMGSVQSDIFGVSLYTGGSAENPASMNVYTSNDNINWQPFGLKNIAKLKDWQYFDFSEVQSFRYLKLVFETSYGSSNIILFEAGVYTR